MQAERVHTDPWSREFAGGLAVSEDWNEDRDRPRRRRRRKRRGRSHGRPGEEEQWREEPDVLLSPEEQAWRRAQRLADEKARLVSEDLWILVICGVMLVVFFPVGIVLTLVWGRRPLKRAYRLFVLPKLRDKFIEQEVEKDGDAMVSTFNEFLVDVRGSNAGRGVRPRCLRPLVAAV